MKKEHRADFERVYRMADSQWSECDTTRVSVMRPDWGRGQDIGEHYNPLSAAAGHLLSLGLAGHGDMIAAYRDGELCERKTIRDAIA